MLNKLLNFMVGMDNHSIRRPMLVSLAFPEKGKTDVHFQFWRRTILQLRGGQLIVCSVRYRTRLITDSQEGLMFLMYETSLGNNVRILCASDRATFAQFRTKDIMD